MDSHKAYCQWNDVASAQAAACSYQQPTFSWLVMAYIAVLVAIATAFLNYPVDTLFEMLAAPTADAVKINAAGESAIDRAKKQVVNAARRASVAASDALASAAALSNRVARRSVAGTVTRKLPELVKSSKKLALASLDVIAPTANAIHLERSVSRLEWSRAAVYKNEHGDVEDDEDSDDEEDSETQGGEKSGGDKVDQFIQLKADVTNQRRLLPSSELDNYDNQWGLDPTGAV